MLKFLAITQNTFLQTLRQNIFGVMIFVTFAMLVISLPLSGMTMSTDYSATDQFMMENVGLSTLLIMGMITAVLSAASAISREIEDRTALTVVSKPVARVWFVLGKFAGVTLAVTVAFYLSAVVFLLTVRHGVVSAASTPTNWPVIVFGCTALFLSIIFGTLGNYMFSWSFIATSCVSLLILLTAALGLSCIVDLDWNLVSFSSAFGEGGIRGSLLSALVMIYLAVILLTAVATSVSTRLGQVPTLLVTFAVLAAGSWYLMINSKLNLYFAGPGQQAPIVNVLCWIIPNLTLFFPMDALTSNQPIPLSMLGMLFLYFVCYTAAVLTVGVAMFQTRQIASSGSSSTMPSAVAMISGLGRISGLAACAIAIIMATLPRNHNAMSLLIIAATLVVGVGVWYLARFFSRGKAWAYYVLLAVSGLLIIRGVIVWINPDMSWERMSNGKAVTVSLSNFLSMDQAMPGVLLVTIISIMICGVLVLPKTRNTLKALREN